MPCTETTCGGTRAGLGVGDTANITEEEGVTIGVSNTEVEAVSRTKLDTKDEAISESDGVTWCKVASTIDAVFEDERALSEGVCSKNFKERASEEKAVSKDDILFWSARELTDVEKDDGCTDTIGNEDTRESAIEGVSDVIVMSNEPVREAVGVTDNDTSALEVL